MSFLTGQAVLFIFKVNFLASKGGAKKHALALIVLIAFSSNSYENGVC